LKCSEGLDRSEEFESQNKLLEKDLISGMNLIILKIDDLLTIF